jgi:hypothetical protein
MLMVARTAFVMIAIARASWLRGNVYQRGGTKLPPVSATREQRWLIAPNGDK